MKRLTIVRGLPGSGKTTWANRQPAVLFEADQYFQDGGEYNYNPLLIGHAHDWCRAMVAKYLCQHAVPVIVANTFTTMKEIQPYIELADKFNLKPDFVECRGNYGSIHGVPPEVIENMRSRWEELPANWPVYVVD